MNAANLRSAFSMGLPFGVAMGAFFSLNGGLLVGVASGAVAGVLFGAAMATVAETHQRQMERTEPLFEGHPILHQGPANHWLGAESRGGWLVLTAHQLSFRSHGKNLQNSALDLTIEALQAVRTKRTFGIIPNGLLVEKKSGGRESFVVSGNTLWEARVAAAIKANPQPYRE